MKIRYLGYILSAMVLFTAGASQFASAHSPQDPKAVGDLDRLAGAASLIFHGKVMSVSYRLSDSGDTGGAGIPFTFVTYSITSVLQGASDSAVTLRFIGGPDGRGGFLAVEGVPVFKPGDEDILFVAGNGEAGCALVMCEFGRYRVYKGAVYEAHGSPVTGISARRIAADGEGPDDLSAISYPAPSFDELMKNPVAVARLKASGMSEKQARARYDAEAPATIVIRAGSGGESARAPRASGLSLNAFLASVKAGIAAAPSRAAVALKDADPNGRIVTPSAIAAAPAN